MSAFNMTITMVDGIAIERCPPLQTAMGYCPTFKIIFTRQDSVGNSERLVLEVIGSPHDTQEEAERALSICENPKMKAGASALIEELESRIKKMREYCYSLDDILENARDLNSDMEGQIDKADVFLSNFKIAELNKYLKD